MATSPSPIPDDGYWKSFYGVSPIPILEDMIPKQIAKSAGRTKIVACGTTDLTDLVRHMAIQTMSQYEDVTFAEPDFHPHTDEISSNLGPMSWNNLNDTSMLSLHKTQVSLQEPINTYSNETKDVVHVQL